MISKMTIKEYLKLHNIDPKKNLKNSQVKANLMKYSSVETSKERLAKRFWHTRKYKISYYMPDAAECKNLGIEYRGYRHKRRHDD